MKSATSNGLAKQTLLFSNDIVGLERTLRAVQAIIVTLITTPQILLAFIPLGLIRMDTISKIGFVLLPLNLQIAIVRRTLCLFRFLVPCSAAVNLMNKSPGSNVASQLITQLDISYYSLMATFLLIESVTLPDMLAIPGLEVFGHDRSVRMNVEAQKMWFVALCCSIASCAVKMFQTLSKEKWAIEAEVQFNAVKSGRGKEAREAGGKGKQDRQRGVYVRIQGEKVQGEVARQATRLVRKMVTDAMDLMIPATITGWFPFHQGVMGPVMFVTTVLSSVDSWENCGKKTE